MKFSTQQGHHSYGVHQATTLILNPLRVGLDWSFGDRGAFKHCDSWQYFPVEYASHRNAFENVLSHHC